MLEIKKIKFIILTFAIIPLISCSKVANLSNNNSSVYTPQPSSGQKYQELQTTFVNVTDQTSAEKAASDLEVYVNNKTSKKLSVASLTGGLRSLSFNDDVKKKLAKLELESRKSSGTTGIKASSLKTASTEGDEDVTDEDIQAYMAQRDKDAQNGLSCTDLATYLNQCKKQITSQGVAQGLKALAETPDITANDIELLRTKVQEEIPGLVDDQSQAIRPLEAVMIGYIAASDDDGTKANGEVNVYASDEQASKFVNLILSKGENQ